MNARAAQIREEQFRQVVLDRLAAIEEAQAEILRLLREQRHAEQEVTRIEETPIGRGRQAQAHGRREA
jgi:hypothetical protein